MSKSPQQTRFVAFKSQLTRAVNSKDTGRILAACDAFFDYYNSPDHEAFPDDWSRWQRARDDAEYARARANGAW